MNEFYKLHAPKNFYSALKLIDKRVKTISCDHHDCGEVANDFIEVLRDFKFIVLDDPDFEGSDSGGWIIFPPSID